MTGGSAVVNVDGQERQINFFTTSGCYFYHKWIYAEVNEQIGRGKAPGIDQVNVTLQDVTFTFSNLPSSITGFIAAIKVPETNEQYTEIGRYSVSNRSVTIPVSSSDLVRYFGLTHYTVWFQTIGGENGAGFQEGASLEMRGRLPDGQSVTITRSNACFGSNPPATPFLSGPRCTTALGVTLPASVLYGGRTWYVGPMNASCNEVCAGSALTYNAADQALSQVSAYCQGLSAAIHPTTPYATYVCAQPAGCHYFDTGNEHTLCTNGIDPNFKDPINCQYCACN